MAAVLTHPSLTASPCHPEVTLCQTQSRAAPRCPQRNQILPQLHVQDIFRSCTRGRDAAVRKALVRTRRKISAPSHFNVTNSGDLLLMGTPQSTWLTGCALQKWVKTSDYFAAVREGSEVTDSHKVRIFPLKHVAQGHEVEE